MANGSDKERITRLEVSIDDIKEDIEDIKTNHLVHLREGLEMLSAHLHKQDIDRARWLGGLGVAFFVMQLIIQFAFKKL
ncbi:MAG: hypothetical protein QME66_04340 [Candidatus Eisenbacteria bacterium]|nr:hypothetical protein [Candidatus Eisenbacteria bacterium]